MRTRPFSQMCPPARRTAGFTLIEVLVVVAIIALLVAILLPSLAAARTQVKVIACRGNLHDLGTAFTMYTETQRGYFPITPSPSEDTYWSLYTASLLKETKVLICPATKNVIRPETLLNPPSVVSSDKDHRIKMLMGNSDIDEVAPLGRDDSSGGHSYEYNSCYGSGDHELAGAHKRVNHFKVRFDRLMLVHENDEDLPYGGAGCYPALSSGGNNCPQPWDNHGDSGMNFMFGDGHADFVRKEEGFVTDRTSGEPKEIKSVNARIDEIWLRSQYPWVYMN